MIRKLCQSQQYISSIKNIKNKKKYQNWIPLASHVSTFVFGPLQSSMLSEINSQFWSKIGLMSRSKSYYQFQAIYHAFTFQKIPSYTKIYAEENEDLLRSSASKPPNSDGLKCFKYNTRFLYEAWCFRSWDFRGLILKKAARYRSLIPAHVCIFSR